MTEIYQQKEYETTEEFTIRMRQWLQATSRQILRILSFQRLETRVLSPEEIQKQKNQFLHLNQIKETLIKVLEELGDEV